MLLENKVAVIHGAGAAIGGAVARAFAREGAQVFLAGRTLATVGRVAGEIARPDGIPETATIREVYGLHAEGIGVTPDAFRGMAGGATPRKRLPTLSEVAEVAAFVASDRAAAMTGTVANLSGGAITDARRRPSPGLCCPGDDRLPLHGWKRERERRGAKGTNRAIPMSSGQSPGSIGRCHSGTRCDHITGGRR